MTGRKHLVVLNCSSPEFFSVKSGVPQGSVLGPLLFLLYVNDLVNGIKFKVKFFADDTMICSVANDPLLTAAELHIDLGLFSSFPMETVLKP